jgi:lipoprotein-releasing system permease protein
MASSLRFEVFVATRYLRAKRRQAVIGVITAISVAGVAAGVASLIVALAITNGFRQDLQQRLLGATAQVQLLRTADDGITNWRDVLARMEREPHVVAAAPAIYDQVMISRGARAGGALVKGIVPEYERRVSDLLHFVKGGSASALEPPRVDEGDLARGAGDQDEGTRAGSPASTRASLSTQASPKQTRELPPIVLGKELADSLEAVVGETVTVTSPQGELTPMGIVPKFVQFRVAGILNSGFYDYDKSWALVRLADAQKLVALGDVISVIEFKVDDADRADVIGREIERAAGKGYGTANWMEQNRALFRALRLERVVTFITIGLIVFVAALNILTSLIMMVMEKTRDIAVLMSMGAKRRQVQRIFMAQGVLVGLVGTALGLVLGYALAWAGGHYRFFSLSAEVYSIDYVPFAPRAMDGVVVALVAIAISFVATIYPSWSAARVFPAEALRYE